MNLDHFLSRPDKDLCRPLTAAMARRSACFASLEAILVPYLVPADECLARIATCFGELQKSLPHWADSLLFRHQCLFCELLKTVLPPGRAVAHEQRCCLFFWEPRFYAWRLWRRNTSGARDCNDHGCWGPLLRGAIVIRTHDVPKNPYVPLFLLTILGPDYYVPP